jgi:hypothetical protein
MKIKLQIQVLIAAYQTVLKKINFIKNFGIQLLIKSVGLSMAVAPSIPVSEAKGGLGERWLLLI